ncbi:MAG: hypothetical protein D6826_05485 [Alphaproteobacteria bacterium]|nr:MAG: hypothetical protein D6826_05485 [Alphaproteobacteria bacterium]
MTHNAGKMAHVTDGSFVPVFISPDKHDKQERKHNRGWRGIFALSFLFLTTVAGYAAVFVLIDKWYKGGSLGIL